MRAVQTRCGSRVSDIRIAVMIEVTIYPVMICCKAEEFEIEVAELRRFNSQVYLNGREK